MAQLTNQAQAIPSDLAAQRSGRSNLKFIVGGLLLASILAATLTTLAEHGICTLRTDLDGDASVDLTATGVAVATARGSGTAGRPGCAPER